MHVLVTASLKTIRSKTTKKRWRHRFPHYKSMGAFFVCLCWGFTSSDLIQPNFSVMSGRSHRFLGNKPVLSGSKVSCSRTQHGGGRYRTPDLSLRSPTLYHWATALPNGGFLLPRKPVFWSHLTQNVMQLFPYPSDATHKIWSRLANWP